MACRTESVCQRLPSDVAYGRPRTDITVEITVTNLCNCHCDYCFECSHGDISTPEEEDRQISLLVGMCDRFDRTRHRHLNVTLWGGEPLMNERFLYRIFESTVQYDFVRYMMYSNGTLVDRFGVLLSQDFSKTLGDRMEVQLSYDGEPHNSMKRRTSVDSIIRVADMLCDRGMQVSFKATLSMDSLSMLPMIWDSYSELHDRHPFVRYAPTLDQTDADNTDAAFEDWKRVLPDVASREVGFIRRNGYPLWNWFSAPGKLACNLNGSVHMHCDGNVYYCHGCEYQNGCERFVVCRTSDIERLEDMVNSGFRSDLRTRKCNECSAVVCAVCHVAELAKSDEMSKDVVGNWTRAMVNSPGRCRFFRHFAKVYYAMRLAMAKEDL